MTTTPDNGIRKVLHSAYTLVRSTEVNKALSPITLDHVIQEQINLLKKDVIRPLLDAKGESISGAAKSSKWDRLERLRVSVKAAVDTISEAGDDVDKLQALGIFTKEKT